MSTEHTIGFGNSARSSSRVIKPPVCNEFSLVTNFSRIGKVEKIENQLFAKKIDKKKNEKKSRVSKS